MIPFFSSTSYQIFGITFQTWGTLVALGYALGIFLAWRRAKARGLDPAPVLDLAFWIFIAAFVGARLFHVLFYEPGYYLRHWLEAVDPREPGFSMFGGLLGGALAGLWYLRRRGLALLPYADTMIWGLPWGCGVGRIGCFLIHDHPGTLTNFILGVKYPDGQTRHDLGLYLSLLGFAVGLLFLWLNRHRREPGFWLGTYLTIEGVLRFGLDFLRANDATYLGLTPTQYAAVPLAVIGLWLVIRASRRTTHVVT